MLMSFLTEKEYEIEVWSFGVMIEAEYLIAGKCDEFICTQGRISFKSWRIDSAKSKSTYGNMIIISRPKKRLFSLNAVWGQLGCHSPPNSQGCPVCQRHERVSRKESWGGVLVLHSRRCSGGWRKRRKTATPQSVIRLPASCVTWDRRPSPSSTSWIKSGRWSRQPYQVDSCWQLLHKHMCYHAKMADLVVRVGSFCMVLDRCEVVMWRFSLNVVYCCNLSAKASSKQTIF